MTELNTQQAKAAYYDGTASNLLVMAGAGTGKTKVIVSRAQYLIQQQNVDPKSLALITFSNRAAKEIRDRLEQTVGPEAKKVLTGTFHSFCLRLIKRMPKSFGLKGSTILDMEDQKILLDLTRKDVEDPKSKISLKSNQLIKLLSYSRNTCAPLGKYLEENTDLCEDEIKKCLVILSAYKKAKKRRGYLDFDDILDMVVKTLKAKSNLRKAICARFFEMSVDEFQDTNPIQFRFLRLFAKENVRLFSVGDPAQTIYGFRGAEFKHIYEFSKNFKNNEVIPLVTNYRSNQEILDISNWLLKQSDLDYSANLTAAKGHAGYKPQFLDFKTNYNEAWYVANQVEQRRAKDISYNDMMVLVRTANDARYVEAEFLKRDIPYVFIGGMAINKAAHVKDLVALLRLVVNKRDDLAWSRFLQLWPKVGQKTADTIIHSFKNNIPLKDKGMERYGLEAIREFKRIRELKGNTQKCIDEAMLLMCTLLKGRYKDWDKRKKDFELIKKITKRYKQVKRFVDAFTLEPMSSTEAEKESVEEAVTIITVHSAKGAEAKICFAVNVSAGTYPHIRSQGSAKEIEEERRILYVCLTRAMDELFITRLPNASGGFYYESRDNDDTSYFFDEVPEDLVEYDVSQMPKSEQLQEVGDYGLDSLRDVY